MKKYRWNYKKCFRNLGNLALKMLFATVVVVFMGISSIGGM